MELIPDYFAGSLSGSLAGCFEMNRLKEYTKVLTPFILMEDG